MRDSHYRGVPALGGPMSSTDPQRMFPDEYGNFNVPNGASLSKKVLLERVKRLKSELALLKEIKEDGEARLDAQKLDFVRRNKEIKAQKEENERQLQMNDKALSDAALGVRTRDRQIINLGGKRKDLQRENGDAAAPEGQAPGRGPSEEGGTRRDKRRAAAAAAEDEPAAVPGHADKVHRPRQRGRRASFHESVDRRRHGGQPRQGLQGPRGGKGRQIAGHASQARVLFRPACFLVFLDTITADYT
ncbi:unnamed protein product [Ectocarpus sp. 12 AP-2014]